MTPISTAQPPASFLESLPPRITFSIGVTCLAIGIIYRQSLLPSIESPAPSPTSLSLREILPPESNSISASAKRISFFHYQCDGIEDEGWGCAWRCIQICPIGVGLFPSFQELYDTYSTQRIDREWAEPVYRKRYLDDHQIPNQLILYNQAQGTKKTPAVWCTRVSTFGDLRERLVSHFQTYATPVMIADDPIDR